MGKVSENVKKPDVPVITNLYYKHIKDNKSYYFPIVFIAREKIKIDIRSENSTFRQIIYKKREGNKKAGKVVEFRLSETNREVFYNLPKKLYYEQLYYLSDDNKPVKCLLHYDFLTDFEYSLSGNMYAARALCKGEGTLALKFAQANKCKALPVYGEGRITHYIGVISITENYSKALKNPDILASYYRGKNFRYTKDRDAGNDYNSIISINSN